MDANKLYYPQEGYWTKEETAVERNSFTTLIDQVLLAHDRLGCKTEQLVTGIAGWRRPVFALGHEANVGLVMDVIIWNYMGV